MTEPTHSRRLQGPVAGGVDPTLAIFEIKKESS
jgi:hypothetical protein